MPPKKDKKAEAADGVTPADDAAKAALEILSLQEKYRSASERLVALEAEHKKVARARATRQHEHEAQSMNLKPQTS